MIDYTDLDLIEDNMFLVGDTENKRDWLEEGPQYECYDLTTLLHNIAVAGALTKSFRLGDAYAWSMAWSDINFLSQRSEEWAPNAGGRPAP